ncbi:hypothetical protein HZC31_02090 [Candidatus Woesearchaeota archaeon]|nr:hypothetical protein [Candidatus Woesearchaeota archaeon]
MNKQMLADITALDTILETYRTEHPTDAANFRLELARVPPLVRGLVGLILPQKNINNWLADPEAFDGYSPLDYLSVLETKEAEKKILEVYTVLERNGTASGFVSVEDIPAPEEVYCQVRNAQCAQLGLIESPKI